jgi:hypothetical protein
VGITLEDTNKMARRPKEEQGSMMKGEFTYVGDDGELHDEALHESILTPEADRAASAKAVEAAIERGMSQKDAEAVYGFPSESESTAKSSK